MKHRTILRAVLGLALALLLSLPAAAFGPGRRALDPAEGVANENQVWVNDEARYDYSAHSFIYTVGDNGAEVRSSVRGCMIVHDAVTLSGTGLTIYRNSQSYTWEQKPISEPGEYVVMARSGSGSTRLMTFTIVGDTCSQIHSFQVPDGMLVTAATLNGEALELDRYAVPMEAEGLYHIEYECLASGITYTLETTVDRTAPEIQFSGRIDQRNRVHSALSFSGLKADERIYATLDGAEIQVPVQSDGTGQLTQSGSYVIRVFDDAGNSSEYAYTILIYLDASGIAFFALLAASAAAVIIYILLKRKRLQVG